jgi:hypothetical protein
MFVNVLSAMCTFWMCLADRPSRLKADRAPSIVIPSTLRFRTVGGREPLVS